MYKAVVDESTTIGLPSYIAAVKEFKNPTEAEKREIFLEASIMAQLSHEHVVRLVRCCCLEVIGSSSTIDSGC